MPRSSRCSTAADGTALAGPRHLPWPAGHQRGAGAAPCTSTCPTWSATTATPRRPARTASHAVRVETGSRLARSWAATGLTEIATPTQPSPGRRQAGQRAHRDGVGARTGPSRRSSQRTEAGRPVPGGGAVAPRGWRRSPACSTRSSRPRAITPPSPLPPDRIGPENRPGMGHYVAMTDALPAGVDPAKPTPARMYDYFLGGTSNFAADRELGDRLKALVPEISDSAWANRSFHQRAARWMADHGVRQFIDIGAGLPTQGNTHDLVQQINAQRAGGVRGQRPDGAGARHRAARRVREHEDHHGRPPRSRGRAEPPGPARADRPRRAHRAADDRGDVLRGRRGGPWGLVDSYQAAIAPGSYLALSHLTADSKPVRAVDGERRHVYDRGPPRASTSGRKPRSSASSTGSSWSNPTLAPGRRSPTSACGGPRIRPLADTDDSRWLYCGVARRP